jgi:ribosomal protein L37AE/L43A
MANPAPGALYSGPHCPLCSFPLPADDIRSGAIVCRSCNRSFEATAFHPPEKRLRVVEVAVSGPEGANACANHARNAAVTSCERCGIFICSLCEMNVGEGAMCPPCFERARSDGALYGVAGRIRDFGAMARLAVVFSFVPLFGLPLGILAIVYARKAIRQRREIGDSIAGMIVVIVLASLTLLGGASTIALMVIGAMQ